jgi:hypothetical protein
MLGAWPKLALAILGCLFWALPLTGGLHRAERFGFVDDIVPLVLIPIAMIALTAVVAWSVIAAPNLRFVVPKASAVAAVAALLWLAIWGAGV